MNEKLKNEINNMIFEIVNSTKVYGHYNDLLLIKYQLGILHDKIEDISEVFNDDTLNDKQQKLLEKIEKIYIQIESLSENYWDYF